MSIQIYHDENTSFAMGQEEEGSWIKEDSIQAGGDEGMLGEYFNPTQSLNQSFQLPQWALEEPINQSSSSSPKPQVGEKRSRRRYRSNSTSSNSSISNLSEGSIDSLPSLTDSQTSVSSLESGSEDEEERGWLSWVRRQGQEDGHWNGKSSGNGAIKGDVIERIGIGMGRENEKMSHMRKKRCSRKIGGKSSTSEDEDSSSNDSITSSPDKTFRIDSTITSPSPSTITSNVSEEKGAISHESVLPLSEPERPKVEFQPLPSNNNVEDSNPNGRTNGSRSNFVDKLVDSAVSTLEEIWSVRTWEFSCSMPDPPSTSTSTSESHSGSSQQVGSQTICGSSPTSSNGCGVTSSPSSVNSSGGSGRMDSPSLYSSPASSVGSSNSNSASTSKSTVKETSPHQTITTTNSNATSSSSNNPSSSSSSSNQLPLRFFVRETLRRSKTSCSVLQTALIYCLRARKTIEASLQYSTQSQSKDQAPLHHHSSLLCQRRTFLAALILSSKFLQDRTYSNKAWSKISGLSVKELGEMERNLLKVLDWNLFVKEGEFSSWCEEREKKLQDEQQTGIDGKGEELKLKSFTSRVGGFNRSISENVQGMEIKFDTEVSTTTYTQESPSIHQIENNASASSSTTSTPIASNSRDSTPTLPLPYPRSANGGVANQGLDEFRPKARLPFRARSQLNPLKSTSSSSPTPLGFGMESLHLSASLGHGQVQHPLSKSMTFTTEFDRSSSSSDWELSN